MTNLIKQLRVASRQSALALKQVDIVRRICDEQGIRVRFDLVTMPTMGDTDKTTSLISNSADDFFTDSLDAAVLEGKADIAVHSAKDLPRHMREGLSIYALTASPDDTDAFVGKTSLSDLGKGAKVGTSSVVRREQVKRLNPNVETVDIRGTIEERIGLVEQGVCDGIIVATIALKRLGLEKHIKEIMPWEGVPLQGQLAIVGRADNFDLKALFSRMDVRNGYGKVSLVGAGPGDPELITVKGTKALQKADCVFYDYLAHKDLLVYADRAEKVYVGKRKGAHTLPQTELSRLVRTKAMEGRNVVRLKGGDPLIFGRGAEEIEYLRSYHIDVDVVPGVSSATSIPSSLGVPLTARDMSSSVAFISGHGKDEKTGTQPVEIPDVDTVVFLMGLTKIDIIMDSLKKAGWKKDVPVMVISRGTCVDEKIVSGTIDTIVDQVRERDLPPPALIIAGQTVQFWNHYSNRQKKILYTGTNPETVAPLGPVVHLPMISISRAQLSKEEEAGLVSRLSRYDMVLFTSRFAVQFFFELLNAHGYDITQLGGIDLIAIGKTTKSAIAGQGCEAALISEIETSKGLLDALKSRYNLQGKTILFPRSSLPNPYLKRELTALGARVDEITMYTNTKLPKRALPTEAIDRIVFTSPSTVRNFLRDYNRIPDGWTILSKGPVTQRSLREAGYESKVVMYE